MPAITLAEAKTHLNITATTYDTELADFIASAEAVIAKRCGPLGLVAASARVQGGGSGLVLPVALVATLTSVTPVGGTALTLADLHLDTAAGVVTYNLGGSFGARSYDVEYQSGRATVPADLMLAVKELVKHLWSTTQRGGSGARKPGSDAPSSSATFLLPYAVQSLIEPHLQPSFA